MEGPRRLLRRQPLFEEAGLGASSDRVLVTGASGFVGSAVARALIRQGYAVRALVRPESPRANLAGLDCELAEGDLRDAASIDRATAGVRHVCHVAADYRLWVRDPAGMIRTNVEGTRNLLEAARRAGVERIVHTSSVATLALDQGLPSDETRPLAPERAVGAYKRSKVLAERLVERLARDEGLPVVIVNPSTPVGPRDIKPTPTGRIIVEAARGRMPAFIDTGLNLVHVDDVAEGHVRALERGRPGERYVLGGQDVMLGELLGAIAGLVGRAPPKARLPRRPLFPLAWLSEGWGRITGHEPMLTVDALRMARYRMFFSSAKAERELGYRARPYREALGEAIEWFRAEGYLA